MGVEGLLPIAQGFKQQFTYSIINPNVSDDFKYKTFLLDGSSWLWNTMKGNVLMDFAYFRRKAKVMVKRFKQCGFKLIVFIDANITTDKLDTWLTRRARRIEKLYAINHKIKSGKGNISGFQNIWFAPCGSYFFCGQVFESLDCKVIYSHIDADRELYGYYAMNRKSENIIGVIGFDTDFLIFPFEIYLELVSVRFNKDINALTFNGYLHSKILSRLRCKQRHLPRIAGIMGCDVTSRLHTCSGNIDYAAKIAKEYEQSIKSKNGKTKRNNFGENSMALKKRFTKVDTFYSGIYPLDIFKHPWCIMLLFQDYNERNDDVSVKYRQKSDYFKGVIMDLAHDDSDLTKSQNECTSVITLHLRRWLYRYLLNDLMINETDKQMIEDKGFRVKELVCYPSPRLCFKEDIAKKQWLKGLFADLNVDNALNPLYNLESYKFIKNVIEMNDLDSDSDDDDYDTLTIEIPEQYVVKDVIFLLSYLKNLDEDDDNKDTTNGDQKENDNDTTDVGMNGTQNEIVKGIEPERKPFVFGTNADVQIDDTKMEQIPKDEIDKEEEENHKKCIKKLEKQNRRKRGKRGGRRKNPKKKNMPKVKNEKQKQNKNENNQAKGMKIWRSFTELIRVFSYQWKYRDIFIETEEFRNALEKPKHKHIECEMSGLKINNRSMHYRSLIYSIYELIYVFLHIEFENQWFPKYYCDFLRFHHRKKHKKNNKTDDDIKENDEAKEKESFLNVPKLKLLSGMDSDTMNAQIRNSIEVWRENVMNQSNDEIVINLKIPYIWQVMNARLFHWIWAYQAKAEKWIKECRDIENLKKDCII